MLGPSHVLSFFHKAILYCHHMRYKVQLQCCIFSWKEQNWSWLLTWYVLRSHQWTEPGVRKSIRNKGHGWMSFTCLLSSFLMKLWPSSSGSSLLDTLGISKNVKYFTSYMCPIYIPFVYLLYVLSLKASSLSECLHSYKYWHCFTTLLNCDSVKCPI